MGCVQCHAPDGGFIYPRNLIEEFQGRADAKIKDKEQALRYRAFFLEWEDESKVYRRSYERLTQKLTAASCTRPFPESGGAAGG